MKQLLIISISALFFCNGTLQAQEKSSDKNGNKYGYLYGKEDEGKEPIKFGVRGGISKAGFTSSSSNITNTKSTSGWNAAGYLEIPIQPRLYIQAGVNIAKNGGNYMVTELKNVQNTIVSVSPIYLQIPVYAVGKLKISESSNAFVGLGPYFGLAFAGKVGLRSTIAGSQDFTESGDIVFTSDNVEGPFGDPGHMKKTDFGMGGMLGVQVTNLTISVGFSQGFANVRAGDAGSIKNQVINVNFGLLF